MTDNFASYQSDDDNLIIFDDEKGTIIILSETGAEVIPLDVAPKDTMVEIEQ